MLKDSKNQGLQTQSNIVLKYEKKNRQSQDSHI